jgi:hypothetical protein
LNYGVFRFHPGNPCEDGTRALTLEQDRF